MPAFDANHPPPTSSSADEPSSLTGADVLLFGRVLVTWSVMAAAVRVATALVSGIRVEMACSPTSGFSLLLGMVNALIGPLLRFLVSDLTWPRLGLVALVVNGMLLEITSWLSENLATDGLASCVLGALVISVAIALYQFTLPPSHPRRMSREPSLAEEIGVD